jgi:hypothetical protein
MVAREDRKKGESTISRVMQQRVPTPVSAIQEEFDENSDVPPTETVFVFQSELDPDNTGFFFESNEIITKSDTLDKEINSNLETVYTTTKTLGMKQDSSGKWNMVAEDNSFRISEPATTSELGEYNKIKVFIDREDHVFFMDWTPGNRRTFLQHPTGGYWSFDDSGDYTFKTKVAGLGGLGGNARFFIEGDRNESVLGNDIKYVRGFRQEQIQGIYNLNVEGDLNKTVSNTMSARIGSHLFTEVTKDMVSIVGGNVIENVQGMKEQNVKGPYVVNAPEQILLKSPVIELRTNNLIMNNKGSITENVGGLRTIGAGALELSTINNMSLIAGQNLSLTVIGKSEEIISGAGAIPSVTSKLIRTTSGNILIEVTLVGDVTLTTKSGDAELSTLLGAVIVQNALAGLNLTEAGEIDLAGPIGSLNINASGVAELEGIRVNVGASASEPILKGNTAITWLSELTVPTGVGPSGTPLNSPRLIELLSLKAFVA